jgi:DNA-binding LytR/AlgR family response regulator
MRILVIDDEPVRATELCSVGDLRIAHGFEQVKFWLQNRHWRPEVVFLDNDMPLASGVSLARFFALDLVGIPVVIWSRNPVAAEEIRAVLEDARMEEIPWQIWVKPYNSKNTSQDWADFLSASL